MLILLVILSACFLYLSLPNIFSLYGFSVFGWFFAVPLFWVLEGKGWRQRALIGLCWGAFSYGLAVNWFLEYHFLGFIVTTAALSFQSILFCTFYKNSINKWGDVLFIPSLWIASELLRTLILGGYSFTIGRTQAFHPISLQIANLVGSYGVSFFLVLVNYCLFQIIKTRSFRKKYLFSILVAFTVMFVYGFWSINADDLDKKEIKICAIQPNISSAEKMSVDKIGQVIDKHVLLTEQCVARFNPDFVAWPEAAVTDDFLIVEEFGKPIKSLAKKIKKGVVVGSSLLRAERNYNSVVLVDEKGEVGGLYDKVNLVPFSEYLPFNKFLKTFWSFFHLKSYDFTSGKEVGVFFDKDGSRFGVTLCSEDGYPGLFRRLKSKGAQFAIVMLNDGWFNKPEALMMHAQDTIMRAVENGIPIVRVANTGLSCSVDGKGRLSLDEACPINTGGYCSFVIKPRSEKTIYSKFGDFFALLF